MNVIPKLAELLEHPERVSDVPLEAIPALCGKLKELDVALELHVALAGNHGQAGTSRDGDRLLDVKAVDVPDFGPVTEAFGVVGLDSSPGSAGFELRSQSGSLSNNLPFVVNG